VIGYVAAIHDVGMTRVQDQLLSAPRPLEDDERQEVARHPEAGVEIIRPLEGQGSVRDLILSHHERWDGSGYPRGIAGEEIPLGARVLGAVDAYESMVTGRPYRAPLGRDQAVAELKAGSGTQFDPRVVEALLRVVARERSAS
jgi:HD-GYP domain-containing protein (c-di-GMP phosphodiesterase class II)